MITCILYFLTLGSTSPRTSSVAELRILSFSYLKGLNPITRTHMYINIHHRYTICTRVNPNSPSDRRVPAQAPWPSARFDFYFFFFYCCPLRVNPNPNPEPITFILYFLTLGSTSPLTSSVVELDPSSQQQIRPQHVQKTRPIP